jgi:hypothetical protein
MSYEYGNCDHHFSEREALCEDWRQQEKAFICPNCKTCLERPDSLRNNWRQLGIFLLAFVIISALLQYFVQGITLQVNLLILVLFVLASSAQAIRASSKNIYVKAKPYAKKNM